MDVALWSQQSRSPKGLKLGQRHRKLVTQANRISGELCNGNGHTAVLREALHSKILRLLAIERQLWEMSGHPGPLPHPALHQSDNFFTSSQPSEIFIESQQTPDELEQIRRNPWRFNDARQTINRHSTDFRQERNSDEMPDPLEDLAEQIMHAIQRALRHDADERDTDYIRRCDDLLDELGYDKERLVANAADCDGDVGYLKHSQLYKLDDDEYQGMRRLGDLYMENPPNR